MDIRDPKGRDGLSGATSGEIRSLVASNMIFDDRYRDMVATLFWPTGIFVVLQIRFTILLFQYTEQRRYHQK